MKCVVEGCNNDKQKSQKHKEGKITFFFSFPKEEDLIQEWLSFCKTTKPFNPKTFRICADHFNPEDMHGDRRCEMGFGIRRTLKPGVIPSRYNLKTSKAKEQEEEEAKRQENKRIVEMLLAQHGYCSSDDPTGNFDNLSNGVLSETLIDVAPQKIENAEKFSSKGSVYLDGGTIKLQREAAISVLQTQNCLEDIIKTLQKNMGELKRENKKLQKVLLKADFDRENLETQLRKIFTEGQIRKIKSGDKKHKWTEEEIAYALPLYTASGRSYNLLLKKEIPLPAIRTLQYWIRRKRNDSFGTKSIVENSIQKDGSFGEKYFIKEEFNSDELLDSQLSVDRNVEFVSLKNM